MAKKKTVPARVLRLCAWGQPNDVAEVPEDQIDAAAADGEVDPHPDAVAYARTLAPTTEADPQA